MVYILEIISLADFRHLGLLCEGPLSVHAAFGPLLVGGLPALSFLLYVVQARRRTR